jgi:hypothetical protein
VLTRRCNKPQSPVRHAAMRSCRCVSSHLAAECPHSPLFERLGMRGAPVPLVPAFAAGFLAVPVFHQTVLALLHALAIVPLPAFDLRPTSPLGVPAFVSLSFWAGLWGIAFALLARRLAPGNPFYWLSAFAFGAVAPTLVYAFVVSPLKTGAPPPDLPRVFLIGGVLNGAWGVGAATFFAIFQFIRRLRAPRG